MGLAGNKETTSDDKGLTAKEQESGNLGNNDSTSGNFAIELDKEYLLNDRTGEKVTGLELRNLANQGRLSRKLQSDLDKTTAEHKTAIEELTQLRREREALVVKATLADTLGLGKTTQQTQQAESEVDFSSIWNDEGEEETKETKMTNPVPVRNRNNENSSLSKIEEQLNNVNYKIQEIEQERKMTANEQDLQRIANVDNEQTFVSMKGELPDIDDTRIKQIIKSENVAESVRIQAMNKRLSGDDSWADDLASSRQLQAKARKAYVEAVKEQETIGFAKENDMSVLGASQTDSPLPVGFTFSKNPEIAQKQWDEQEKLNREQSRKSGLRRRSVI